MFFFVCAFVFIVFCCVWFLRRSTSPRSKYGGLEAFVEGVADNMARSLGRSLSYFKGRISQKQQECLRFECLLYLFFYADVCAFEHQQSEPSRQALTNLLFERLLVPYFQKDPSLEPVAEERLKEYSEMYRSKDTMFSPPGIFVDNASVIAKSGDVHRNNSKPLYGAIDRVGDFMLLSKLPIFHVFMTVLKDLFDRDELVNLPASAITGTIMRSVKYAHETRHKSQEILAAR